MRNKSQTVGLEEVRAAVIRGASSSLRDTITSLRDTPSNVRAMFNEPQPGWVADFATGFTILSVLIFVLSWLDSL